MVQPLISVAGKTVLGHVLDMFAGVPAPENVDIVFIVAYLREQAEVYVRENYPHLKAHYVDQQEMRGQSHAIWLARQYLNGPAIVAFVDTLIETDLSFLANEPAEAVACVKPVPDPRRFGVAEIGTDGCVKRLIEKPQDMSINLAVVGFYYFKKSEDLLAAIEEQMRRDIQLKNEYFLADAVNIMLENGLRMRTVNVAAALSLAGIGADATRVQGVADPTSDKNVHEIEAEGAFGRLAIRIENVPSPTNPKTQLHGCPLRDRPPSPAHRHTGCGNVTRRWRQGSMPGSVGSCAADRRALRADALRGPGQSVRVE